MKRYHCEFKNCNCRKFKLHCNQLCLHCNHSNIWHARKEKPPLDQYLSFVSPRLSARSPTYVYSSRDMHIFIPEAIPVDISEIDEPIVYCTAIEVLPV